MEVKQFDGKDALEFITHNEWDWQEKAKIKFKGNNRASGIERILWFCPKCHSHRTIKSKGNIGYCKNCGEKFYVSELGYINDEKVINILDLQKQILNTNFKNIQKIKHVKVSIREKSNNNKLKLYIEGSLLINEKGIEIKNKFLEFSKIKGITTFLKRITEFIYDNKYVVRIKTENDSLLLYYLMRRYKDVYWNN
ncbi:MAG: hypothetical protein H0Z24_02590 [Thermosipho sp. (in: Bacteria)]|nr:hypothetical protein [Thermosipho sp. (in: thermotogales)]